MLDKFEEYYFTMGWEQCCTHSEWLAKLWQFASLYPNPRAVVDEILTVLYN